MVRVFYSQKTEDLIQKMTLTNWRKQVQNDLDQEQQDMSDNWKMCAIGERINLEGRDLESIKDLSPETINLGYDFSIACRNETTKKHWRLLLKLNNSQQFGEMRKNNGNSPKGN